MYYLEFNSAMEEENSKYVAELVAEKAKLDPSLSHCSLLLAQGMFLKSWFTKMRTSHRLLNHKNGDWTKKYIVRL